MKLLPVIEVGDFGGRRNLSAALRAKKNKRRNFLKQSAAEIKAQYFFV
jgi:hypothetical protein